MPELVLPPHAEVTAQLHALAVGMDASELHGSLCGYLSGGGEAPGRADWIARMLADPEAVTVAPDSALDHMFTATAELLDAPDFGFEMLLPDDDAPVTDLGRIAGSELSYEDPTTDEEALEEVAEFVRVAALLLHSDCVLGPRHRRSLN